MSGSESVLVSGWERVSFDIGKYESLHKFRCWEEKRDCPISSVKRIFLARFQDGDGNY